MEEDIISDNLKEATYKKNSGDVESAIILLRKAYLEISKTTISYPVETFLRLPLYLQAINKTDEAWQEFNNLIEFGFPNQMKDHDLVPFDESAIYDKMRLFLQREGKNDLAIIFGILSYLKIGVALHRQQRIKEFSIHKKEIEVYILPLLKKAREEKLITKYVLLTKSFIGDVNNINFSKVKNMLAELL